MFPTFDVPALWIPSGKAGRLIGLSTVKLLTFGAGIQGVYLQALTANVRVTLDGTTPLASGNDIGFVLRSTDPPVLITGQPGQTLSFLQDGGTAVLQYQMLTLGGRYGN